MDKKKRWLWILAGILVLGLIGALLEDEKKPQGGASTTPTATDKSPQKVGAGARGKLQAGDLAQVAVAIDRRALEESTRASTARDTIGYANLVASGRLLLVDRGTAVQVIDNSIAATQIRILEGPQIGKSGWIPAEWIATEQVRSQ